jgi:hypothetical protein
MQTYKGRHRVGKGTYWNLENGQKVVVETEGGLPGDDMTSYIRLPSVVMLTIGQVVGVLYVLALPVLSIAMIAAIMGSRCFGYISAMTGKSLSFGWRPRMAYLSGKNKGKRTGKSKM